MTDRKCNGTNRAGNPCGRIPGPGFTVCSHHGSKSPQAAAAAQRRLQRQAAEQAVTTYGLPVDIDPGTALAEEVQRTAGHVAWLGAIISGMQENDLIWGVVEQTVKPAGENGAGGVETKSRAVPNVWLTLYQEERAHYVRVSKAAVDAGVSERMTVVWERSAQTFIALFNRVLDRIDLTPEQAARIPDLMTAELVLMHGGGDR